MAHMIRIISKFWCMVFPTLALSFVCQAYTTPSIRSFTSTSSSFRIPSRPSTYSPLELSSNANNNKENNENKINKGKNWIEKSSPMGISMPSSSLTENDNDNNSNTNDNEAADYTLGIDGESFSLGTLSLQVYEALTSVASKRFPSGVIPPELEKVYQIYAMDVAAKEATQLALKQNGLVFDVTSQSMKDETEEELWGELEHIRILSSKEVYDSTEEAVQEGQWKPGNSFSFIVRNVRAKEKELDISELLASIDPDGSIRTELDSREVRPEEYGYDPSENKSLKDIANDNEKRCNEATRDISALDFVSKKNRSAENDIIQLDDIRLKDDDSTSTIMQALESHTYLLVDLGAPPTDSEQEQDQHPTQIIHNMWNSIESFFSNPDRSTKAPKMEVSPDAGSRHAVFGYATYDNDAMQFLETRQIRNSESEIVPKEIEELIGQTKVNDMIKAFEVIADIGKDITTIATAAATEEANAYTPDYDEESALEYAQKMTNDLLDNGRSQPSTETLDTTVSMSPHRMCRYAAPPVSDDTESSTKNAEKMEEIFGAHTDTSFVTIIPVAAVSGLEVFDVDQKEWTRPESIACEYWEREQEENEQTGKTSSIPWHCRYLVVMPGELLQLSTRSMIPASVHRVVAVNGGTPRLSAPVLLRARSKMVMDVESYFGENVNDTNNDDDVVGRELLLDCHQMTMEQIHDALQP